MPLQLQCKSWPWLSRLPDIKQSQVPTITPKAWAKAHLEARVLPPK